jgi:hypothetical protein
MKLAKLTIIRLKNDSAEKVDELLVTKLQIVRNRYA